jgi:hypothetical protein
MTPKIHHPTTALQTAPRKTKMPALKKPQSMSISTAATLFTITAHDTALAALGRS